LCCRRHGERSRYERGDDQYQSAKHDAAASEIVSKAWKIVSRHAGPVFIEAIVGTT